MKLNLYFNTACGVLLMLIETSYNNISRWELIARAGFRGRQPAWASELQK